MIEIIRRYSTVITVCLLALCAATLLYSQFRPTPGDSNATSGRRALYVRTSTSYQLYQYGMKALQERKDAVAEQDFRASIRSEEQNPLAWVALAELLRKQGKATEALRCYQNGLGLHPDWSSMMISYWDAAGQVDPETALRYAQLCDSLGHAMEAETAYAGVVSAVEHRRVPGLRKIRQQTSASPRQKASLAIALWRDHRHRQVETGPAMMKTGLPKVW
jgi:tetratricopeptide (TPR) repeat protein